MRHTETKLLFSFVRRESSTESDGNIALEFDPHSFKKIVFLMIGSDGEGSSICARRPFAWPNQFTEWSPDTMVYVNEEEHDELRLCFYIF